MPELTILLAILLIASLLIDGYFSYRKSSINKQLIEIYREEIECNRELNRTINALRSEFGFKVESLHKPIVPHILRMRWLDYQRDNIDTVPFVQWTANELAKRLESEENLIKFWEGKGNVANTIHGESDKALHGHYQEYLAICQSEKKPMLSFTHWKAQIGKEESNV